MSWAIRCRTTGPRPVREPPSGPYTRLKKDHSDENRKRRQVCDKCPRVLSLSVAGHGACVQRSSRTAMEPAGRPDVELRGQLGAAYDRCVRRLGQDPYHSLGVPPVRPELRDETVVHELQWRHLGRFLEMHSLTSPPGKFAPETLPALLRDRRLPEGRRALRPRRGLEHAPGTREPRRRASCPSSGNSRLLMGLLEAHRASGRPELLECARRIGDFYIATAGRSSTRSGSRRYRATRDYAAAMSRTTSRHRGPRSTLPGHQEELTCTRPSVWRTFFQSVRSPPGRPQPRQPDHSSRPGAAV